MSESKTITIKSKTENLKTLRKFVSDFAKKAGFGEKEISDIALAVDEAATNIIKHAYKYDETRDIIARVTFENGALEISLKDFGAKFDPSKARLPDIEESLKLKKAGGLGIYLMKKLTDKLIYRVDSPDFNEIVLIKKLKSERK